MLVFLLLFIVMMSPSASGEARRNEEFQQSMKHICYVCGFTKMTLTFCFQFLAADAL